MGKRCREHMYSSPSPQLPSPPATCPVPGQGQWGMRKEMQTKACTGGGKQNQSPGKAPDAPQAWGGLLQKKPWDYPRESCNDQRLQGSMEALGHSSPAQRLGFLQRHPLLQLPQAPAAPRHLGAAAQCCCCGGLHWGMYMAGDPLVHHRAG